MLSVDVRDGAPYLLGSWTERQEIRCLEGVLSSEESGRSFKIAFQVSTEDVPRPPQTTVVKDHLQLVQHNNEHCHSTGYGYCLAINLDSLCSITGLWKGDHSRCQPDV